MECICHITVVLKWNYRCVLELQDSWWGAGADGSWKAAATLWDLGHRMQIHHWGLYGKKYQTANSPLLTSSLNCNWKWRIWFCEHISSLQKAPRWWTDLSCLTPSVAGELSAWKSCNRFVIHYILPGSWPRFFVMPTAGKQPVLSWVKHLESAFCALGEGKGRRASTGTSSARVTIQGSALGRAKTFLF